MAKNVRDVFSERLGYLLPYTGKTQIEMANALHVATGTVSSWVNGQKFPRADMIERIADYLGVRMSTLIEENGLDEYMSEEDERQLLRAYHAAEPAIRAAVRKLLDLPAEQEKESGQYAG